MRNRTLFWKIYPPFLMVTLLAVLGIAWHSSRSMRQFYLDALNSELTSRARLLERQFKPMLESERWAEINQLCKSMGQLSGTRITVISASGKPLGDSDESPELMDNHADRPEVAAAARGQTGSAIRYSQTLQSDLFYIAIPSYSSSGQLLAIIRTSRTLQSIDLALQDVYRDIAVTGAIVTLLAILVCLLLTRRITQPLQDIERGARRFAAGDLHTPLPGFNAYELNSLARTMNQMAGQLHERLTTVMRQRSETEAVLASMSEGLIAVDLDEIILKANQSALDMLGLKHEQVIDKSLPLVIRNPGIQKNVVQALRQLTPVTGETVIHDRDIERSVKISATALLDQKGRHSGAMIVLNDVSEMYRLEKIRRDFVANVSHELRTPITSIQGFVETLVDGALEEPETANRFLGIIHHQVRRLTAIIDDLLLLSRLEHDGSRSVDQYPEVPVKDILEAAVIVCRPKAEDKNQTIETACPPMLTACLNRVLIEQALVNLVNNAISYSPEGSAITVAANVDNSDLVLMVTDHGCGIPGEHLPRIFERFYRVDRARSRECGGTGLGLAIVKHITQLHGGTVGVESESGKGSKFTMRLPQERK